jgi:hypothetical protein
MTKPFNVLLHYDATQPTTVTYGTGTQMSPACGQTEEIGVTNRPDLVECLKCKAIIEKAGA